MYFDKLFLLLLTSLILMSCTNPKNKSIKVILWNIWTGLHGTKADEFKKTANTLNVLKVLQYEKADVLLMQETYCCGMEIAQQAGYPHSVRASSNLSIHSRYPIIDSIKIF